MYPIEEVKNILADTLNLGQRKQYLQTHTALLGSIVELDSMAVINVITSLEEHFDIVLDDDEIDAHIFETVGSLAAFVARKLTS